MAIISFKCPNCGGELIFDPATQKYKCEYCNSLFAQEELDAMKPMQGEEPEAAAQERAAQAAAGAAAGEKAETGQTAGKRTGGRGGVLQLSVLRRRDCDGCDDCGNLLLLLP